MTMMQQKAALIKDQKKVGKIGPIATFFAIIKGYCAIVILVIPKAF